MSQSLLSFRESLASVAEKLSDEKGKEFLSLSLSLAPAVRGGGGTKENAIPRKKKARVVSRRPDARTRVYTDRICIPETFLYM